MIEEFTEAPEAPEATPETTEEVDPIAAAAAALAEDSGPGDEGPGDEDGEAPEDDEPPPAAASATDSDDKPEPEPEEKPDWREKVKARKILQRRERQLAEKQAAFEAQQREFEASRAEAARAAEIAKLAQRDPEAAFQQLGELAGVPANQLFERLAHRRLHDGEEHPEEAKDRVARLEAQLEAFQKQQAEERERAQQQSQQAKVQACYDHNLRELMSIQTNPELQKTFPGIASMHPGQFQAEASELVRAIIAKDPSQFNDLPGIAQRLDKAITERILYQQDRFSQFAGKAATSVRDTRAAAKDPVPNGQQHRPTLTNTDAAASGSSTAADSTPEELIDRAAQVLLG